MLERAQLQEMLALQDKMNCKVNPEWATAGYPFLRAVMIEGAEAIEHHGWKWWKKQTIDMPQLQMELVDIWHFALSNSLIEADGNHALAANRILTALAHPSRAKIDMDGYAYWIDTMGLLERLELLVALAAVRKFRMSLFDSILSGCGMDWGDLHRQYIGKNVLNFFRQDNGYKTGEYQKDWGGREDNVHLVEILAMDHGDKYLAESVYRVLSERYAMMCAGKVSTLQWR